MFGLERNESWKDTFVANVSAYGNCHENDLRIEACPEHLAKFSVGGRQLAEHLWEVRHFVAWGAG